MGYNSSLEKKKILHVFVLPQCPIHWAELRTPRVMIVEPKVVLILGACYL